MTDPTSPKRPRRKPAKPIAGRALIVACALAGTLGGWGALAFTEAQTPTTLDALAVDEPALIEIAAPAADVWLQLQPLPTVIPPTGTGAKTTLAPLPDPIQLAPMPTVSQQIQVRPVARARSSR